MSIFTKDKFKTPGALPGCGLSRNHEPLKVVFPKKFDYEVFFMFIKGYFVGKGLIDDFDKLLLSFKYESPIGLPKE